MDRWRWQVAGTWDGEPAATGEVVNLSLSRAGEQLHLELDAPFHGDPEPPAPPGPTPGLWNHEVVELFLVGADQRYLEIEIGPGGHHWVLQHHGVRRPVAEGLELELSVVMQGRRWKARAAFPRSWLPAGLHAANAFAIHGEGAGRRYLAAHPLPGAGPDFHRLELFPSLEANLLSSEQAPRGNRQLE
jgi:hypothetical protein